MKHQGQGVATKPVTPDNESVRDFIAIAVHDLREPLRAIRLGAQLLGAGGREQRSAEDAARGSRYIEEGVERMEALIQNIAECCYAEVRELQARETDLDRVLVEVLKELNGELKSSGAIVTRDTLPAAVANAEAVAAIFRCLVANACRFHGDAPPRIHIGVERKNSDWIFSVKDEGIGFDPTYSERIFRPFERLNGRQFAGSGLGLSLAKRMIERCGGTIRAESRVGEGATFRFSLPVAN